MHRPTLVASACMLISLLLTILCAAYVVPYRDSVVRMTVSHTVGDIYTVNSALSAISAYPIAANTLNISGVVFAGTVPPQNGSVLQALMDASGCSLLPVRPYNTPVTRSERCQCISRVYQVYVNETSSVPNSLVSTAAGVYRNVSVDMRGAYKDRLMGCLSSRPVWQVTWCGARWCERSPLELAYLMNSVLLLCVLGYLLIVAVPDSFLPGTAWGGPDVWRDLIFFTVSGGLITIMWLFSYDRFHIESIGIAVVFLNLVVNLHPGSLNMARMHKEAGNGEYGPVPHPLVLCLFSNLKVLLPLYSLHIAILGYARDWVSFLGFGVNGFIIALSIQSLMCAIWYSFSQITSMQQSVCMLVLAVSMLHSILLTSSYTYTDSPYIHYIGTPFVVNACTAFLAFVGSWEYTRKGRVLLEKSTPRDVIFTLGDASLFAVVQITNLVLTAFSISNAALGKI